MICWSDSVLMSIRCAIQITGLNNITRRGEIFGAATHITKRSNLLTQPKQSFILCFYNSVALADMFQQLLPVKNIDMAPHITNHSRFLEAMGGYGYTLTADTQHV